MQEYLVLDDYPEAQYIIGIDECGHGAIAGPLTVCVAVLERDQFIEVKDSKLYTSAKKRKEASELVKREASFFSMLHVGSSKIEQFGQGAVLQAAYLALAKEAINHYPSSFVVIDGKEPVKGLQHPQISVIGGDRKICAVSAASVVGKVARDELMIHYAKEYKDYQFEVHKGYPTPQHLQLLQQLGVTEIHRKSIQRVADVLRTKGWYAGSTNK